MLSREQFCKIAAIPSIEALKSRAKRGQLPVSIDSDVRKSYGYSFFDAALTILANLLTEHPTHSNPVAAASIAREIAPALAANWKEVVRSAQLTTRGKPHAECEWMLVWHPGTEKKSAFVGSAADIAKSRGSDKRPALYTLGGNAARVLWLLIHNAKKHQIELPVEFWEEKPTYVVGDGK